MRVIVEPSYDEMSRRAAQFVADLVRRKPNCVLGLATGSTPVGLYKELVRLHRNEGLDFSQVISFNLDEYVGLPPEHDQSYRYFMQKNLFDHINVDPAKTHVPDGMADDIPAHCLRYEQMIKQAGGIDLQVLGIGGDGHIAFNEPGSSLSSRTRLKTLTAQTIEDNARFFDSPEEVPQFAITMGIATILEARECLMLISGMKKAKIARAAIEGPVTTQVTASVLQMHPDAIAILDEEAACELERLDYYRHVEKLTSELQQGMNQQQSPTRPTQKV